jgi:hypothetical protein
MPLPSLIWNAQASRFFDPATGQFISRTQVRQALEESLANLTRHTDTLVDDLRAGRISLTEWRDEMRTVIKQTQMAAAEVANGGRAQMTQADYGRVGQKVYVQYQYLDRWVEQIKSGAPFDNTMEARASLYLRNGRVAFVEAEKEVMRDRGFEMVRNVLHAQESCAQCIAESERGLVPVETMSIPGSRTCLANCRCVLVYERAA